MAVDGRLAFAVFANGDLAACDFEGNLAWSLNLGVPSSLYGFATSLALYQGLLIVQYDQGKNKEDQFDSKLFALHTKSGKIAWEKSRPVVDAWTSPIIYETETGPQLFTVGCPWYIAYDPSTGEEIWKVYMEGGDLAPSPTFAAGLVFALVPNYDMCAIRIGGSGDVTETHIAWVRDESIPDVASPVANDELLFLLCNGLLTCCETRTGKKIWEREFDADFQSSPTLVGDNLYLLGAKGTLFVAAASREYKEIGRIELKEPTSCSPAFVNNRIYIRGAKHLICLGKP
jgi:outer membrane protein assembly factor BamB